MADADHPYMYVFLSSFPFYLEHDLGGSEGLLAHDDHVAVGEADALLRVQRICQALK